MNISEIADFQKGFAFKSKDYQDSGVRIIRVTNLNKNDFEDRNCMYIDPLKSQEYLKYVLHANDAVISTVGSWPTNPESVVGKVCIIPEQIEGSLLNQNALTSIERQREIVDILKCIDEKIVNNRKINDNLAA